MATLIFSRNETKIKKRQIKIEVPDNFLMVMDLAAKGLVYDRDLIEGSKLQEFTKKFNLLTANELKTSLSVSTTEFQTVLSQNVPCVGCRRSVERLYLQIDTSGYSTLDPIKIKNGTLTVCDKHVKSSQLMCTLLYKHDTQLNQLLENQPRNKKSSRCNLHSLDSFRTKPFSETWIDTWDCMKQNCKDKIAVVEAKELHATLDNYLKKHKFCQECRTKVEKAYTLLVNESNPNKEKGYVNAIYSGIKRCLKDKHIHLPTGNDYIEDLIRRAEPELIGSHSRHRERHAKTMEIAQEEVLTCIGMCIYNRLKRVQQCVKEEENACQVLGAVAVYALCRSFDMAVENKRGINLELIYDEISRDEKIKEAKKEQKKLKKRKKKNEKKLAMEEEGGHGGCDPEPVSDRDKCACSADDNQDDDYDDEDGHSHDEDDDSDEKIVLCDGTIIDVGPSQGCNKKGTAGGGGNGKDGGGVNNHGHLKIAQTNNSNQENHHPNHNNHHAHHQNHNPNHHHQQQHHSCTEHNSNSNLDAVSVTSCHSCNNETDGHCTQRSIDAGYESHHDSGSCCLSSNSNNNSSRTSSIASTPEGSEVACSDLCCNNSEKCGNGQANKLNKRNVNNAGSGDGKCTNGDSGLVMSLEQMLLDDKIAEENEIDGTSYIPDEDIVEFMSRNDIKQKREALREKLLKNFNDMCKKKCCIQDRRHQIAATDK